MVSGRSSWTAAARRSPPCREQSERRRLSSRSAPSSRTPRRRSPTGPAPWPASCSASSTTSTGRCASRWRSSPSATTRPPRRLAMARRLREKQPKVVYLELCEDMAPLLTELRNCRLPVARPGVRERGRRLPAASGPRCRWSRRSPRPRPSTRRSPTRWTPRASSWSWSTAPPTTSSSGSAGATGQPTGPTPTRTPPAARRGGGRAARRRGRRGDRRPAAALRRAGGAPAAPRQGPALVGVVAPVRRTAARRRRPRHLPAGHVPDRQPVPAAGARRPATGCAWTRTASATCGPGCASTWPRPAPTRRTASTSAAHSTPPAGSTSSACAGTRHLRDQPAHAPRSGSTG